MVRMGSVISLREEAVEEYRRLHREAWPEVLAALSGAHLRNYSIYLREPENLLFSYWEYEGEDFDADMAAMLAAPRVQDWWNLCAPMHAPFDTRAPGEWWAGMTEIFHLD